MELWDERALSVLDTLTGAGYEAVLVGGCVRDRLMGTALHDYDAATSATPEEMLEVFRGWHIAETGRRHGTLTIFSEGLPVEVTTFRTESTYSDHRHPDAVSFTAELSEDLSRRDFTVNAMAWNRSGLTDLFGGQEDLKAGILRCVGTPAKRFEEDALRMLRALRFSAKLGFSLHPDTAAALRQQLPLLEDVSRERVCSEFLQLLCAPHAVEVLLNWPEAVTLVLPELAPSVDFDQHSPYHKYTVYEHSVRAVGLVPAQPVLRLAALLHDCGKPACYAPDEQGAGHFPGHAEESARLADQAARRLRMSNADREKLVTLVARHGMHLPAEARVVRRWLSRLGEDVFFDLMALDRADSLSRGIGPDLEGEKHMDRLEALAREALAEKACLSLRDLSVNGRDAMAAGLRGPAVGQALTALLEDVVEGRLPNRRDILLQALAQR